MTKEEALKQIEVNESEISSHLLKSIEHKDKAKKLNSRNRTLLAHIKNLKIVEEYNIMYSLNKDHFKTQKALSAKYGHSAEYVKSLYYKLRNE